MNAIELKKITKRFGDNIVFKDLDLTIQQGETTMILGESGKGKTTLLKCLIGLERIDSGTIKVFEKLLVSNGKYVDEKEQKQILKDVGIIFQNYNLFPNLTLQKNLEIVCKDKEKIDELLNKFDLYEKKDLYPQNLSGGQKQRVAIIRTLLLDPKIIIFDEPTSALDDKNHDKIVKIINELEKKYYTIVIVTHDSRLINNLDCKIFDMNKELIRGYKYKKIDKT